MIKWTGIINFIVLSFSFLFLIGNKPIHTTIGLLIATALLWFDHKQRLNNNEYNRDHFFQKLIILVIIPLCGSWYNYYTDNALSEKKRNFLNYLESHDCKYVDDIATGITKGGCDRYGNCQDSESDYEPYFKCKKTGNDITFSEFKKGYFGSPSGN